LIGIAQAPNKKTGGEIAAGPDVLVSLGLFSDFFNVAASRPAKSPRNGFLSMAGLCLRQCQGAWGHRV